MNRLALTALTLALVAATTGPALAADAPGGKTRAQVRAELEEAIRNGEMVANDSGHRTRDIFTGNYPPKTGSSSSQTRQ